jgi:hypothetical protein
MSRKSNSCLVWFRCNHMVAFLRNILLVGLFRQASIAWLRKASSRQGLSQFLGHFPGHIFVRMTETVMRQLDGDTLFIYHGLSHLLSNFSLNLHRKQHSFWGWNCDVQEQLRAFFRQPDPFVIPPRIRPWFVVVLVRLTD